MMALNILGFILLFCFISHIYLEFIIWDSKKRNAGEVKLDISWKNPIHSFIVYCGMPIAIFIR